MRRSLPAVLAALACAACGNNDNVVYGSAPGTTDTQAVIFDNVNSVINARVSLTDANGMEVRKSGAIVISDQPGLCDTLKTNPGLFTGTASRTYEALILFVPADYLGTFLIGRLGPADQATNSWVIGAVQGHPVLPAVVVSGYVALTNWSDSSGDNTNGSFDLIYGGPQNAGFSEFAGKYRSSYCPALANAQFPGKW